MGGRERRIDRGKDGGKWHEENAVILRCFKFNVWGYTCERRFIFWCSELEIGDCDLGLWIHEGRSKGLRPGLGFRGLEFRF